MNCPNCHQQIEAGAAFCGNCGHALGPQVSTVQQPVTPVQPLAAMPGTIPTYARANPVTQAEETKALLAVLCGVVGIVGALFMALIGLVLGIIGLIFGTT